MDIAETQGHKVDYPTIGDPELKIVRLYGMLPAGAQRFPGGWKAPKPYLRIVPQPE